MCACVPRVYAWGCTTAPPIRHGPEGPLHIRTLYTYIVYVLYSQCCRVPYSQRTPLRTSSFPLSRTPIPPPPFGRRGRQSSTGSGRNSSRSSTRLVVVLLMPPPRRHSRPILLLLSLSSTNPKSLLSPIVFQRSLSRNGISTAVRTHLRIHLLCSYYSFSVCFSLTINILIFSLSVTSNTQLENHQKYSFFVFMPTFWPNFPNLK